MTRQTEGLPTDKGRIPVKNGNSIRYENLHDEDGNPTGGVANGTGMSITWQNGPLGRGEDRRPPNGAQTEDVIIAAMIRLEFYESGKFSSPYNAAALDHLQEALNALNARTADREERGVEGLHKDLKTSSNSGGTRGARGFKVGPSAPLFYCVT